MGATYDGIAYAGIWMDTSRWLAGSQEQVALRAWLAQYRDRLQWDEVAAAYRVDG